MIDNDISILNNNLYKMASDDDKLQIHFDWFSFTFPLLDKGNEIQYLEEVISNFCDLLGFNFKTEINRLPYANNFYEKTYLIGENICVRAFGDYTLLKINDSLYQSAQLEITGTGCREIEDRQVIDYYSLFYYICFKLKGKTKRVDIAIDDLKGDKITLNSVKWYISHGYYTSKFFRKPPLFMGDINTGLSITFGSHGGNQLCIYDKKFQLNHKYGFNYYKDYHVRYEMRFCSESSNALINGDFNSKSFENGDSNYLSYFFLNNDKDLMGEFCKKTLLSMLTLKKKNQSDSSHQYRVDILPSWLKFLDNVSKEKFSIHGQDCLTLEKKANWFVKNMSGLMLSFGISGVFDSKNDKNVSYNSPFISMFVSFLYSLKEKLRDKKFRNTYFPSIKNYLSKYNNSFDIDLNSKDSLQMFYNSIDNLIYSLNCEYCDVLNS